MVPSRVESKECWPENWHVQTDDLYCYRRATRTRRYRYQARDIAACACLSAFSHRAASASILRCYLCDQASDPPPTPSLPTPLRELLAVVAKAFSPAKPALGLERSRPLLVTTRSSFCLLYNPAPQPTDAQLSSSSSNVAFTASTSETHSTNIHYRHPEAIKEPASHSDGPLPAARRPSSMT